MSSREKTNYIVIHCSATNPRTDIGVKEIDKMHRARGFNKIGYHVVIRRNGIKEIGRLMDDIGAHVKNYNSQSVGICLVGGVDFEGAPENNFTPEQFASLKQIIPQLKKAYPIAKIVGHRDLSPDLDGDGVIEKHEWIKECPCFDVKDWLKREGLPSD